MAQPSLLVIYTVVQPDFSMAQSLDLTSVPIPERQNPCMMDSVKLPLLMPADIEAPGKVHCTDTEQLQLASVEVFLGVY